MRYRWPDPATMVTDYYRSRTAGPVAINYPNVRIPMIAGSDSD
jgi:hypothetical protein